MRTSLGRRLRIRSILSGLIFLWLGIGPLATSTSLWGAEAECCCGGESVCLLGGCDCGRVGNARLGECGGLRSADGANDDAVAISFARHLGLVLLDLPAEPLLSAGRVLGASSDRHDLPARAPDPPPPRPLGAL